MRRREGSGSDHSSRGDTGRGKFRVTSCITSSKDSSSAALEGDASLGATRRTVRSIRRYPVLSGIVAVMFVAFVAGVATGFDLLVRLNYVLVLLLVVSWAWSKLGTAQLTANVSRPTGPFAVGDSLRERISIRNVSRASKAWVEIEDVTDLPGVSFREVVSLGSHGFVPQCRFGGDAQSAW